MALLGIETAGVGDDLDLLSLDIVQEWFYNVDKICRITHFRRTQSCASHNCQSSFCQIIRDKVIEALGVYQLLRRELAVPPKSRSTSNGDGLVHVHDQPFSCL